MKKIIAIIVILLIIFISMVIYKYVIVASKQVTIEDVDKVETFISNIYCWKEVTNEALPIFHNINEAQDKWIWEVVKKNLDEYEVTAKQLQDKGKEIFGNNFKKEYENEENGSFEYNKEKDKYIAKEILTDVEDDSFLVNKITKIKNGYDVEIIEYLADYSNYEQNQVIVKNLNEEVIATLDSKDAENEIIETVKNNNDKFTIKKITLKYNNKKLYVEKVEG